MKTLEQVENRNIELAKNPMYLHKSALMDTTDNLGGD